MNYYIKTTLEMGRGLYAVQDLQAHKILFTAELIVLSEQDTQTVAQTELQFYTFKYSETQDCLVLGDGELFNHSDEANIGYKLIDYDGRKVMAFYTLKDIPRDAQLCTNYSQDIDVRVQDYINAPSLVAKQGA